MDHSPYIIKTYNPSQLRCWKWNMDCCLLPEIAYKVYETSHQYNLQHWSIFRVYFVNSVLMKQRKDNVPIEPWTHTSNLAKNPTNLVIRIGTNDAPSTSKEILNKLKSKIFCQGKKIWTLTFGYQHHSCN